MIGFPNMAGKPDIDDALAAELEAAGIEVFRLSLLKNGSSEVDTEVRGGLYGWSFQRAWYYWRCNGPGIEAGAAERLHAKHGKDVRVAGHCGCPSPTEWYKGLAVGSYHVDTQAGLKALADTIKGLVERKSPEVKAEGGRSEPVAIKPLEWTQSPPPAHEHEPFVYWAAGIGGHYRAERNGLLWMAHDAFIWVQHASQKAAKAAAQADYEQRIRSALVVPPASPPDVEAIGFAVMSFGKINVTTVSPTRRGALVNWLVSSARIPVFQWTTDDEIESSWRQLSGRDHKCAEVSIAALLDGGRKP